MNRNIIRINEGELVGMVSKSVKMLLSEAVDNMFSDDDGGMTGEAQRLIDAHNAQVGNDIGSYFIISVTGRLGKYYTLYFFSKPIADFGRCNPFLYKGNLSQTLIDAVRKVIDRGSPFPIRLMPEEEVLSKIQRYGSQFFHSGKYQGKSYTDVYEQDPKYILWCYKKLEEESEIAKPKPGGGHYFLTKKQKEMFESLRPFVETYHQEQIRTRRETIDSVHLEGDRVENIEATIIREPQVREGMYGAYVVVRCQAGNTYFILYAKPKDFPDIGDLASMKGATVRIGSANTEPTEIYGVKYNKLTRVKGLQIIPASTMDDGNNDKENMA